MLWWGKCGHLASPVVGCHVRASSSLCPAIYVSIMRGSVWRLSLWLVTAWLPNRWCQRVSTERQRKVMADDLSSLWKNTRRHLPCLCTLHLSCFKCERGRWCTFAALYSQRAETAACACNDKLCSREFSRWHLVFWGYLGEPYILLTCFVSLS